MQGKRVRAWKEDSLRVEAVWALHKHFWHRLPLIRRPLIPSLVRKPIPASLPLLAEVLLKAVRHGWKLVAQGEGEVLRAQVLFPWVQAGSNATQTLNTFIQASLHLGASGYERPLRSFWLLPSAV